MVDNTQKITVPTMDLPDLANPEVLKRNNQYIRYIITFDLLHEANSLRHGLQELLKRQQDLAQSNSDYYTEYERIIALASFVAYSFLTDHESIELVENHLADALSEPDIVLEDKVITKVTTLPLEERDKFKRELREAIQRNKQLVTSESIVVSGQILDGLIGSWIRDYNSVVGAKAVNQIERVQYLTSGTNIQKIRTEERKKVKTLINLYELLKKSSDSVEGFEEAIPYYDKGVHYILKNGTFVQVKDDKILDEILHPSVTQSKLSAKESSTTIKTANNDVLREIQQGIIDAYQGDARQQKAINNELGNIKKKIGDDVAKLRDEFYKSVQKKNVFRTIALLRLMAEKQDIPGFLAEDKKLHKFLAAVWEKRYGKEFVAEFDQDSGQVQFVRMFLRYILEERLGMAPSDAARVGLQIGNIFVNLGKKSYNKVAYFDVGSKSFHWFE